MIAITRHPFINIFQTKHFLVVKFSMVYEKNMIFLVIREVNKNNLLGKQFLIFLPKNAGK